MMREVLPLDISIPGPVVDVIITLLTVVALAVGFGLALVLAGGDGGGDQPRTWR
jgi:hypothetical protein